VPADVRCRRAASRQAIARLQFSHSDRQSSDID